MSNTPGGGNPQGWENKLADRSSLPPVPGEERGRPLSLYPEVSNFNKHHASKGRKSRTAGSGSDAACGSNSPPACLRWARNLHELFEDADGVQLFQQYVSEAGPPHDDRLNFYFACKGLKQQKDALQVKAYVSAIYKFLKKSQLTIPEDVRRRIKLGLKDEEKLSSNIFDSMQAEVEKLIEETTYLSFLQSDTYLQHAQNAQNSNSTSTHSSGSLSSSSSSKELYSSVLPYPLATLHEGEELRETIISEHQHSMPSTSQITQRLTRSLLMATQERRLQQSDNFSNSVFGRNKSVYSYPHHSYAGYCPTSKQDSELQSMSSGRTDSDALSMSGSSVDGISICRGTHGTRREHPRHLRSIMDSAALNRSMPSRDFIPRTFRVQKGQYTNLKPDEFAHLLMERLEKVKRDQDNQEKFDRKIIEGEEDCPSQTISARTVTAALREKLQLDDDNDQDILDQHVSRVWSDRTPARSPGRPTSPPHPQSHGRKYDLHSTLSAQSALSADSGNVRDFSDAMSMERASSNVSGVSKSRSVPDYNDQFLRQSLGRRSLSRRTLTDFTDSGVSVVSDTTQPHLRILTWIKEGANNIDRYGRKTFSRSGSAERPGQPIATDPQMPLLPSPHTATQLDEARRRLLVEQHQSTSGTHSNIVPRPAKRSGQPSGKSHPPLPVSDSLSTIVIMTFLDEPYPYRTKIPSAPVTLKQFKEFLPKKGNYRYFFKTECEEVENKTIQEEISNDNDVLPLWEGKIMARVMNT